MKQLPHIAARLYCEAWNILPAQHAEICRQFRGHLERGGGSDPAFAKMEAANATADDIVGPCWRDEEGRAHAWHPQVQIIGSTAILPVKGILGKHLSTLEMWCGSSDYSVIAKQARNIADDDRITEVILYIDSPGGTCVGGIECANAIAALSAKKFTAAYTDKICCSAAYFIAAACETILAAPSAIIGSISTYAAYLDESRAYEMEGLEVKMFRSGEVKGAGYPGKPWTPQEMAAMQAVTDAYSDQFKGFVRDRRNVPDAEMQGQYWPAGAAPGSIVDELVDDLESVLEIVTG